MIASVRGPVAHVGLDHVVVEVGGIGMLVHATPATASACRRGSEASLATSLVVREDSLTLFGFSTPAERDMFVTLQTVSGVGPRLALAMLSVMGPDQLAAALSTGDSKALTTIPGIGAKSAERLVLELRDKVGAVRGSGAGTASGTPSTGPGGARALARPGHRGARGSRLVRQAGRGCRGARRRERARRRRHRRLPAAGPARAAAVSAPRPAPQPERGFASEMLEAEDSACGSRRGHGPARVVDAAGSDDDRLVEAALRPKRLSEFPGQPRVRDQLGLVLEAARRRGSAPDHVLLSGPPGLGKTTLAMIVAAEIEKPIRVTSGPAIQHAGDLAAVLSSLDEGEVLFLDEIHRMSRSAEEMLYLAMEDFRVDVIVGKGPGATAIPLELPPFTVVGATTRAGLLPAPLRDRFGFTAHLDYYDTADLITILHRSARLLGVQADEAGIAEIASRSRGTPRIANRLLRRVRDWAQVHGQGHVDSEAAHAALALFDVDDAGPRPARPGRARGPVPPLRWRPGRAVHPRGGGGGGVRHRRDRRRALPRARGLHRAHAARAGAPQPGAWRAPRAPGAARFPPAGRPPARGRLRGRAGPGRFSG